MFLAVPIVLSFSCDSNDEKKNNKHSEIDSLVINHKNSTNIEDSIFYFFKLYKIDSIAGFDKYFLDTSNQNKLKSIYQVIQGIDKDYSISQKEKDEMLIFFKQLVLNHIRTEIYLSQKSPISLRACYEGTQNQAMFSLRENGSFDIHWTSTFGGQLFEGTYTSFSDTIILIYETEQPQRVGDTLILLGNSIMTINKAETNHQYVTFTQGNCPGLN